MWVQHANTGTCMLAVLWWATNWLTRAVSVLFVVLVAVLWWLENGFYLRYVVLFLGVMSASYALHDIVDDLVIRKVNQSDAAQFSRLCCHGLFPSTFWGAVWLLFSLAMVGLAVLAALAAFKS